MYKHSRALLQKWCGKPFPRPTRLTSGIDAIQANRKKLAPCMKSNMVTSSTYTPISCHIRATNPLIPMAQAVFSAWQKYCLHKSREMANT